MVLVGSWLCWVSKGQYWLDLGDTVVSIRWYWLVLGGTGSVKIGTAWYFVVFSGLPANVL